MSKIEQIQEVGKSRYEVITEVEKFNPYHDARGRFSSADGATSFTYKPGQGAMYDNAIRRERERQAAMGGAPKKGLAAGLGEEHAKAIEKTMQDSAPAEVKAMWDKYGDGVKIADAHYAGTPHSARDGIHLNAEKDISGSFLKDGSKQTKMPYQTAIHESAHAIDDMVSAKVGYDFAVKHNGGKFEQTLIKESNDYIKGFQKELQAKRGSKVSIDEARKELSMKLFAEGDWLSTAMQSDILGGATKGKFTGTAGHDKSYWTGVKTYWGKIEGHSVATEAFAHFTSLASNSKSAARIQSVFPESYKEYLSMCQYAASLE